MAVLPMKFFLQEVQMKSNIMKEAGVYLQARKRLAELERVQNILEARSQNYPQGKIHLITRGGRVMYYLRSSASDRTGVYISVRDEKKIKTYLQKSYDEKSLRLIRQEIRALEKLLQTGALIPEQIQNLYLKFPERARKFVMASDLPDEVLVHNWLETPYEGKSISDLKSDFITEQGEHVRSKSELNIANALYRRKIPYKYECPLTLRSGTIYPDFTILNVRKRTVLYWEHRGMMDDHDYARNAVRRLKDYQQNQIYPGEQLIITEETSVSPLGTGEINAMIREYCL